VRWHLPHPARPWLSRAVLRTSQGFWYLKRYDLEAWMSRLSARHSAHWLDRLRERCERIESLAVNTRFEFFESNLVRCAVRIPCVSRIPDHRTADLSVLSPVLSKAHGLGVAHGDIVRRNVVVREGQPHLIDWEPILLLPWARSAHPVPADLPLPMHYLGDVQGLQRAIRDGVRSLHEFDCWAFRCLQTGCSRNPASNRLLGSPLAPHGSGGGPRFGAQAM
jgi:hypothetical protein